MSRKLAYIQDNDFQILQGNKYEVDGRTFIINISKDEESLNTIGVRYVIFPTLEQDERYTGNYELVDGEVYALKESYTPITEFDVSLFKGDLKKQLDDRMFDLYPMWGVINDNLKTPMLHEHYVTIKFFIESWKTKKVITQVDYDKFIFCFNKQGIDLLNY